MKTISIRFCLIFLGLALSGEIWAQQSMTLDISVEKVNQPTVVSTEVLFASYKKITYPEKDCRYKGMVPVRRPSKHLAHFHTIWKDRFPENADFSVYTNLLVFTDYTGLKQNERYAIVKDSVYYGYVSYEKEKERFIISNPYALPIGFIKFNERGTRYNVYDALEYFTSTNRKSTFSAMFPWYLTAGVGVMLLSLDYD